MNGEDTDYSYVYDVADFLEKPLPTKTCIVLYSIYFIVFGLIVYFNS